MISASSPALCLELIASRTTCRLVDFAACRYFSKRLFTPGLTYTAVVGFERVRGRPGLRAGSSTADTAGVTTGAAGATGLAGVGTSADTCSGTVTGRGWRALTR